MRDGPTLVVLAAGMGRRFGGLKQLEPLGPSGETLMEYSIFDAMRAGFGRVVLVVRTETRDAFGELEARIADRVPLDFAIQSLDDLPEGFAFPGGRTRPWGTGQAVLACRQPLADAGAPFAVVNADDFYGADAFVAVAETLHAATPTAPPLGALAGYQLRDTLPSAGSVSRAVCEVDADGRLTAIEEILAIERHGDGGRFSADDGIVRDVAGDTLVSMNLWGCPLELLPLLDDGFREFLARDGASLDAEFLLPRQIDAAIRTGMLRVQVVAASGPWCGITRPEDGERAREVLRTLVAGGTYPRSLW